MVMHRNETCMIVMRLNLNVTLNICMITTIMIFLIITNVIMINGIWKTDFTLKLSHKLYIYQCILGLFDGLVMLPLYLLTQTHENEVRCSIALLTLFGIIHQSLLELTTLALLSISRYYRISYHFSFSGKRVMFVYILTYAFTVGIASIMLWYRSIFDIKLLSYISIGLCIMNFILQTIIVSANILLLKYVRQIGKENTVNNINIDYQKHAIKTILLLSISLIICAFPTVIAVCISCYQRLKEGKDLRVTHAYFQLAYILFTLFSGINSVIYIFRSKGIIVYYKAIILNNYDCTLCTNYVWEMNTGGEMTTTA